ncbi:hypothetical protein DRH29_05815, partial [candidate division Kazan bacterium]
YPAFLIQEYIHPEISFQANVYGKDNMEMEFVIGDLSGSLTDQFPGRRIEIKGGQTKVVRPEFNSKKIVFEDGERKCKQTTIEERKKAEEKMPELLKKLQPLLNEVYGLSVFSETPRDIEGLYKNGRIYLVQCRRLDVGSSSPALNSAYPERKTEETAQKESAASAVSLFNPRFLRQEEVNNWEELMREIKNKSQEAAVNLLEKEDFPFKYNNDESAIAPGRLRVLEGKDVYIPGLPFYLWGKTHGGVGAWTGEAITSLHIEEETRKNGVIFLADTVMMAKLADVNNLPDLKEVEGDYNEVWVGMRLSYDTFRASAYALSKPENQNDVKIEFLEELSLDIFGLRNLEIKNFNRIDLKIASLHLFHIISSYTLAKNMRAFYPRRICRDWVANIPDNYGPFLEIIDTSKGGLEASICESDSAKISDYECSWISFALLSMLRNIWKAPGSAIAGNWFDCPYFKEVFLNTLLGNKEMAQRVWESLDFKSSCEYGVNILDWKNALKYLDMALADINKKKDSVSLPTKETQKTARSFYQKRSVNGVKSQHLTKEQEKSSSPMALAHSLLLTLRLRSGQVAHSSLFKQPLAESYQLSANLRSSSPVDGKIASSSVVDNRKKSSSPLKVVQSILKELGWASGPYEWIKENASLVAQRTIVSSQMEIALVREILRKVRREARARGYSTEEIKNRIIPQLAQLTMTGGLGALMPDEIRGLANNGADVVGITPLYSKWIKGGEAVDEKYVKILLSVLDDTGIVYKIKDFEIKVYFYKLDKLERAKLYFLYSPSIFDGVYPDPAGGVKRTEQMVIFRKAQFKLLKILKQKRKTKDKFIFLTNELYTGLVPPGALRDEYTEDEDFKESLVYQINHSVVPAAFPDFEFSIFDKFKI